MAGENVQFKVGKLLGMCIVMHFGGRCLERFGRSRMSHMSDESGIVRPSSRQFSYKTQDSQGGKQ